MAYNMERWHSAVQARFSVRRYDGPPGAEELTALAQAAERIGGQGVRILLGQGEDIFRPLFLNYGRITGATHFAAFVAGPEAQDHTVGYMGEAFILEATALGLGTCWWGGASAKAIPPPYCPWRRGNASWPSPPWACPGKPMWAAPAKAWKP